MKTTFSFFSALCIASVTAAVQALDCPTGTKAILKGEANNNGNVVLGNGLGEHTLGVAKLTLKDKSDEEKPKVKLTCALLGEPRGLFFPPTEEISFDHMIACNGPEIAFETRFVDVGTVDTGFLSILDWEPVLSEKDFETYCGSNAAVAFVERAEVNENRDRKDIFDGASGGLDVFGCVNNLLNDMDEVTGTTINMRVKGKLCLPNW